MKVFGALTVVCAIHFTYYASLITCDDLKSKNGEQRCESFFLKNVQLLVIDIVDIVVVVVVDDVVVDVVVLVVGGGGGCC